MKLMPLSLGALALVVMMRLETVLRPLPWGASKVILLVMAAGLLAGFVWTVARTAGRLKTLRLEESWQSVYAVGLAALALLVLALSVPAVVEFFRP